MAAEGVSDETSVGGRLPIEAVRVSARPPKKPRKRRPIHSCRECRRLKMKCDRNVPCSNCVRRQRSAICQGPSTHHQPLSHVVSQQSSLDSFSAETSSHCTEPPKSEAQAAASQSHNDTLGVQSHTPASEPALQELDALAQIIQIVRPKSASGVTVARSPARRKEQLGDHDEINGSHGTLMCTHGGRSKYLGPTAGSEWLKDTETRETSTTPPVTRAPSPETGVASDLLQNNHTSPPTAALGFPFDTPKARISTRELLGRLPSKEEAWILAESYYRYCAWHHDVVPKASFREIFDRTYEIRDNEIVPPSVNVQEIALIYMIMAQGTLYNIEMAYNDPSAEEWLQLSQSALTKGDFLAKNTVPGLQTLHLMAHHYLESDQGHRGDTAWPLWGLVMRLMQAMGLHRDGSRWNLPQDVIEERRRVFWECNAADVFQAHCFSRPSAVNPDHCDTEFPTEAFSDEKSYTRLRFELSQLSSEILNEAMKVRRPRYSSARYTAVTDLDVVLCGFEHDLPFSVRCRAALLSMPSRYPSREEAIKASPEPSRTSMAASFQQTNLSINISETFINLHRPYYAKALYENLDDPVKSIYASSYLTVIERCSMIIAVVADVHARFPAVSIRQWNLWFHVFNSALCLGTLVFRNPRNPLGPGIISQLGAAISMFTSLIHQGANTSRYRRNLRALSQLHNLASSKIAATSADNASQEHQENPGQEDSYGEDLELIGWRTRLIERAGQHRQTIKTISATSSPNSTSDTQNQHPESQAPWGLPDFTFPLSNSDSALPGDLLHNFWDPLLPDDLLADIFEVPGVRPTVHPN